MKSYQHQIAVGNDDRLLPQTGSLRVTDPVLSTFPQILSDQAACRVFMMLWRNIRSQNSSDQDANPNDEKTVKLFREVVLKVWRAYTNSECMRQKLDLQESIENVLLRETKIKEILNSNSDPNVGSKEMAVSLPFNARELVQMR